MIDSNSIRISYPLGRQLIGFFAIIVLFAIIFKDIVVVGLASIACYYFVAFFFIASFEVSNSELIVIYPYRLFFRKIRFKINTIQSLQLYKNTGGKFNSPTIKLNFIESGKSRRKTISFLMPASTDFTILGQALKENIKNFEYFEKQ